MGVLCIVDSHLSPKLLFSANAIRQNWSNCCELQTLSCLATTDRSITIPTVKTQGKAWKLGWKDYKTSDVGCGMCLLYMTESSTHEISMIWMTKQNPDSDNGNCHAKVDGKIK